MIPLAIVLATMYCATTATLLALLLCDLEERLPFPEFLAAASLTLLWLPLALILLGKAIIGSILWGREDD